MPVVFVKKSKSVHHPRVEAVAGVARDLANHVRSILEPLQLASGRHRKDCALAILAPVAEARYVFAIVSETRFSVV
jgi:hypothetical protein